MQQAPASQANVEYWFRLLYELVEKLIHPGGPGLSAQAAHIWNIIIVVGIALSAVGLLVLVYATVRLFELRQHEEHLYGHINIAHHDKQVNKRWVAIEQLVETQSPSDWRQAIIEADIMLDDALRRQGFTGSGVGEKLQSAGPKGFETIQLAWDAHKVRNQIAHQGSSFDLSPTLAHRTMAQYQAVFEEFKII